MTALVDRLAAAGYVSRTRDTVDRRAVRVELRPATWRAFAEVYRPLGELVQTTSAHLPPAQRQLVIDALTTMAEAFDDARNGVVGR